MSDKGLSVSVVAFSPFLLLKKRLELSFVLRSQGGFGRGGLVLLLLSQALGGLFLGFQLLVLWWFRFEREDE